MHGLEDRTHEKKLEKKKAKPKRVKMLPKIDKLNRSLVIKEGNL